MNPYRDEVSIKLAGQCIVVRPTFAALAEMEGRTGIPLLDLVVRMESRKINLLMIKAVIEAGIRGAGGVVPDNLGELILREGLVSSIASLRAGWLVYLKARILPGRMNLREKSKRLPMARAARLRYGRNWLGA